MTAIDPPLDAPPKELVADRFTLRLYVAGHTPKSIQAIENLTILCETHLAGRYSIQVVDILEDPRLARSDKILAVPTLIRAFPEPVRRIIGDLSDAEKVLIGLQLRPGASSP